MSDKPRRFWQIHLSTVVIAALLAGVLMGLNFRVRKAGVESWRDLAKAKKIIFLTKLDYPEEYAIYARGWPFVFSKWHNDGNDPKADWFDEADNIEPKAMVYNISIAAAAIILCMVSCEYLFRRRSKP